jgi:hypothetical protein
MSTRILLPLVGGNIARSSRPAWNAANSIPEHWVDLHGACQRHGAATTRRGPALLALPLLCFPVAGSAVQAPDERHEMILLPPCNSETADRVQPL